MQNLCVVGRACAVALVSVGCDSRRDALVLTSAGPRNGIQGTLAGPGAVIAFASRVENDALEARIFGEGGRLLWSYREEAQGSSTADAPKITVAGMPHSVLAGLGDPEELQQILQEQGSEPATARLQQRIAAIEHNLRAVASSAEGSLIRQLALELVERAPAPELVAERRGLETAFQALQHAYPDGYPAASVASTSDYYVSPEAGYIVLTQHELAHFRHNHEVATARHDEHRSLSSGGASRHDDENQVNACYGHCGAGCTNSWGGCTWGGWSHVYDGGTPSFVGQTLLNCACRGGIQEYLCDQYDVYASNAWHTFTGKVANNCIVHDACCRSMWGGCGNPLCYAPMIAALADSCSPFTWAESWTYYGPQNEVRYAGTVSLGFCETG